MTWLAILLIVALVAAVFGLSGTQPDGSRPIARTRLIGVARAVLLLIVVLVAYVLFRDHAGTVLGSRSDLAR